VAERLGAEIVSVDSMLVYRGMDVGTAKPTAEQRARVPHHLLDVAEPSEPFSVAASRSWPGRRSRGSVRGSGGSCSWGVRRSTSARWWTSCGSRGPIPDTRGGLEAEAAVVGATGLHERLAASDPAAAAKIEPGNVRRTVRALEVAELTGRPFSSFAGGWETYEPDRVRAAGVWMPTEVLRARIEARVTGMLERGWIEEVHGLVERGFGAWLTSAQAIGYAELARHLAGELTLDAAIAGTVKRTRALARRQLAFFRRDPRIRWFEAGEAGAEPLVEDVVAFLSEARESADG
jgi:tRNA dimethylallyltransferase